MPKPPKLNQEKVKLVKFFRDMGWSHRRIARYFSVHHSTIQAVLDNYTWKWVKEE